ncbi:hypothetical protein ASPZODRAFT_148060 [Penicilliopsis zonata CBS 506.65]|uniref:HEAT repeat protein n=1 Tax=Penicilliopsis zonata CBS 506.65 TaxID=1073090 RepID=A0A1L9STP2_9EURO|nr:hypothetical protein ASPZODRAFT_148060 [Penicilliopsis zonata CBS 506.65]OJJ50568.1 hypothetical protein ASPZODRAFT_148060 [Penicilliopsis zonata CBS 506.65]
MESLREQSFKKLKPPCVELSAVGLRFRGRQATSNDVFRSLEPVHRVLKELSESGCLDEKLAEYAFFPLTSIFNETQRVSARCLELAVDCLTILVARGWRQRLSPPMGKQLVILLTLIIGGSPSGDEQSRPEELAIAGFKCLATIFNVLEGPVAERTIFHEIGTATVVDQTVYVLLEGILDDKSDELCIFAADALEGLYMRITDRVVLASIMPRTISALTKSLKPTTQIRRSYRLIEICLRVLTRVLNLVLNDQAAASPPEKLAQPSDPTERPVLDESWLKATTSQVKLALANVFQTRRHQRPEVKAALLELCTTIIEQCPTTLRDSLPMTIETVVALSDINEHGTPNEAYSTLKHLTITYPVVLDSLKESLHTWLASFPRTMQGNDETSKQWAIKQISTTFQILSQTQSGSEILTATLASGLCDSVVAAVASPRHSLQPLNYEGAQTLKLEVLHQQALSDAFPPVLLEHRSQRDTLKDLGLMITKLNMSDCGDEITRSIISRVHHSADNTLLGTYWLALNFLKNRSQSSSGFDDFICSDVVDLSPFDPTRANMAEELYYISLPLLNEAPNESQDWRISALALEAVAIQAQQLGEAFRPELMDALYPTIQLLASNNSSLQKHAMACLNVLTKACNYPDTSTMVIENVDYLTNSVALKLNTFDVSPYPPQVLFMMVKLCGAKLIPYVDDLVDSIFGVLDMYHGYPKLVETMFKTLAAIVEEGAKRPALLSITNNDKLGPIDHHKKRYQGLSVSQLAEDLAAQKSKQLKYAEEDLEEVDGNISHPKRPWSSQKEEEKNLPPSFEEDSLENLLKQDDSDEPLPAPREPDDTEKPLTKAHNILLHIVRAIPSHLSSPSAYLRRSLLSILLQAIPVLSQNENSFLPFVNEVWPSVASRINFPSSLQGTEPPSMTAMVKESSTTLSKPTPQKSDDSGFQEEVFVIVSACNTIEALCKGAGDFMATRVEAEFPRWERLYRRAWEKVSQDAEKALGRRAQHQHRSPRNGSGEEEEGIDFLPTLNIFSSQAIALSGSGSVSAWSSFTPHHSLWKALTSLFITLLTHVRLPLSAGDQICVFLAGWIARFAGSEYYFRHSHGGGTHAHLPEKEELSDSLRAQIQAVDDSIHAMQVWNADLTWFLFQKERARVREITQALVHKQTARPVAEIHSAPVLGIPNVNFAAVVF